MKRVLWMVLIIGLLFCFCRTEDAKSAPIVIKAVTQLPKTSPANDPVGLLVDKINRRANGKLKIDWVGGPEVIKAFDQPMAVKSGAIDMILYIPFGYLASVMPEAYCKGLSELAEWEERKSGAYELWSEIFAKRVNAKYLGRLQSLSNFVIYTKKKVEKLDDFKGLKLRVMPLYVPFIKALGAAPVTISLDETYTALERGVVDGLMYVRFAMISLGFQEVTKYVIEPGVFQLEPATMINLDVWNKIPKDSQETIMDVMKDMEYIGTLRNLLVCDHEDELRRKAGMQFVRLPPEDAEKYHALAYEETWKSVLERASEYGPKLRELTSKKALPKGAFPWN